MSGRRLAIAAAVVLVLGVVAAVWYFGAHPTVKNPPAAQAQQPAAVPPPAQPAILHPMPDAGARAGLPPLPALNDSDAAITSALGEILGADAVKIYLVPENVIRRIVATVDNLPRQKTPVSNRARFKRRAMRSTRCSIREILPAIGRWSR